jgi:conjugative relaxase-like TrwC/TraI family protein
MLTVAALGSGQARYYLSLTSASYYTEAPEPDGRWYGLGADEFALKGTVRPEDLTQLCEGFDPRDPSRHVRNAGINDGDRARKHGDDLCFSAPKSVSVAWALGPEELRADIEKAMHRAVKDALDYI